MAEEQMIYVAKSELEDLRERDAILTALEEAGVDNWEGYDEARRNRLISRENPDG